MFAWIKLRYWLRRLSARKRLQLATYAQCRPRIVESETSTFGLLSVICLIAAFGFLIATGVAPRLEDQIFTAWASLACFLNFVLFLSRFIHFDSARGDVDRIERLRSIVRGGPSATNLVQMSWRGQRPANDFELD